MFDNLRNPKVLKLWREQQKLKKELEKISAFYEKDNMSVVIRGDKRVEKIVVNGEENKALKDLVNEGMKLIEKKLEKDMKGKAEELMDMLK